MVTSIKNLEDLKFLQMDTKYERNENKMFLQIKKRILTQISGMIQFPKYGNKNNEETDSNETQYKVKTLFYCFQGKISPFYNKMHFPL